MLDIDNVTLMSRYCPFHENKLPLVGIEWNIVVVLTVSLAQSYTLVTEYLGCILSGGSGKNGSTIAVSFNNREYQFWPTSSQSLSRVLVLNLEWCDTSLHMCTSVCSAGGGHENALLPF